MPVPPVLARRARSFIYLRHLARGLGLAPGTAPRRARRGERGGRKEEEEEERREGGEMIPWKPLVVLAPMCTAMVLEYTGSSPALSLPRSRVFRRARGVTAAAAAPSNAPPASFGEMPRRRRKLRDTSDDFPRAASGTGARSFCRPARESAFVHTLDCNSAVIVGETDRPPGSYVNICTRVLEHAANFGRLHRRARSTHR